MGYKGTSNSKSLQLKDTSLDVVLFAIGDTVLVSEVTGQLALASSFESLWEGCFLDRVCNWKSHWRSC